MASVRLRAGLSRFWEAIIWVDGKRRSFSTGLEDRAEALHVAHAAEMAARKHKEQPHQLRVALERLAEAMTPAPEADPGEWLARWAEGRAREVKPSTLAAYLNTAAEAREFFARKGVRKFSAVTRSVLVELREEWSGRNSASTVNSKVRHLSTAFSYAVEEKLIAENPAAAVPAVRAGAVKRREFRAAELQVLLPTLGGEWRAIVLLGLYTGQRLNDLAVLRWSQVDLAARTMGLCAAKTGAVVALPLVGPAVDALAELPAPADEDPDAPVFPEIAGMSKGARSNSFRRLLAKVGLARPLKTAEVGGKDAPRQMSELSFHSLRHTATTMLKAAGVSDAVARAIVGHESAAVSRSYTHLDLETMRQALEKMPAVG